MTDLERLWDDLPTPPPPVDTILRAGRTTTAVRRRRRLTRPLVAGGALVALGGAFVAGTVAAGPDSPQAGGGGTAAGPGTGGTALAAFQADLPAADSCQQLLAAYVDRGLSEVTAYGWTNPIRLAGPTTDLAMPSTLGDLSASRAAAPQSVRQVASETGTNVQEAGVDEPDTVKTDGSTLVRLRGHELEVFDVTGAKVRALSTLDLPDLGQGQLLLSGDTVVALGADTTSPRDDVTGERSGTRVMTVSLADPEAPSVSADVTYASTLLSARQHGSTVRLVLSAGLPDLGFVSPTKHRTAKQALRHNRRVVERSTIDEWLPTYDTGGGSAALLDCRNVAIPPEELGLDTVSVVGFDAASPTQPEAIGLAGRTEIAYESADDLYLAASPGPMWTLDCWGCAQRFIGGGTTYLFDFALDGIHATHVASGEVEGSVADRWSMDSVGSGAGSMLRVAVGQSSETGAFNSIVTFRRDGTRLVGAGRLDHLGRNEDIKSVRWFDDLAILATYHQVDPLYAVDLSPPSQPRLLGKLKVPGFSSYLHPLGPNRILGLGEGRTGRRGWGAQAALFDVSDPAHVRRLTVHHYANGSTPVAGTDPRAFTWLPDGRHVLTVIQRGRAGYVSVMWVHAHKLHERSVKVEYGTDIASVRTLGLPDGRVVLVTGEQVRFFPV